MPIYEYECKKCGDQFEVQQSMKDDPLRVHEDCGGDLVKVISQVGIVWKGAGFYKTDSRSASMPSASSDAKDSSANSSNSDSSSSDSSSSDSQSERSKGADTKSSDTKRTDMGTAKSADKGTVTKSASSPTKSPQKSD